MNSSRLLMSAIKLFVLSVLLLMAGCATQRPLMWKADDIAANRTSAVRLTNAKTGETIGTLQTERARRLIEIKNSISATAGQNAELRFISGKEPNAMSTYDKGTPVVAFNLGMIDLFQGDDDAFAAILGHEFAHLVLGHGAIREQREQGRQVASGVLGLVLGIAGVPGGGTLADLGTQMVTTVYSRDEERDADRYGMDYMKRAGFDPQGAVRAWEKMNNVSGFSIPFLSTHPQSAERLETMKRLAEQ